MFKNMKLNYNDKKKEFTKPNILRHLNLKQTVE